MKRTAALLTVLAGSLALSACGFKPIYATQEGGSPISSQIQLERVVAPENVAPYLEEALNARIVSADGVSPRYELVVQARENADRLAVQIDATVTRYNYRLRGRYWVLDRETGERVRGVAEAITSYNIVNSQYSTLFAERAAVEKAARQLAEEIERDMLIRFSRPPEKRDDVDQETFDDVLETTTVLQGRRQRSDDGVVELPDELQYLTGEGSGSGLDGEASQDGDVIIETDTPATENAAGTETMPNVPDVPDPVIDDRP